MPTARFNVFYELVDQHRFECLGSHLGVERDDVRSQGSGSDFSVVFEYAF
jgi:hypothetical protein